MQPASKHFIGYISENFYETTSSVPQAPNPVWRSTFLLRRWLLNDERELQIRGGEIP